MADLDNQMQVPQDRETTVQVTHAGGFVYRYAYARSADTRAASDTGQDYLVVNAGLQTLAFALCDGVSQSFYGDLAARVLGDGLCTWLCHDLLASGGPAELSGALATHLQALTMPGTTNVQQQSLPTSAPDMVREVLERKRALGSESTFVCGRIDHPSKAWPQGRLVLAWMGDSRLRFWGPVGERTTELGDTFQTNERWSTYRGPVGVAPHVFVAPLRVDGHPVITRLLAYSDGLSLLDQQTEPLSNAALDQLIAQSAETAVSDDISLLEIWLETMPVDADLTSLPVAQTAAMQASDPACAVPGTASLPTPAGPSAANPILGPSVIAPAMSPPPTPEVALPSPSIARDPRRWSVLPLTAALCALCVLVLIGGMWFYLSSTQAASGADATAVVRELIDDNEHATSPALAAQAAQAGATGTTTGRVEGRVRETGTAPASATSDAVTAPALVEETILAEATAGAQATETAAPIATKLIGKPSSPTSLQAQTTSTATEIAMFAQATVTAVMGQARATSTALAQVTATAQATYITTVSNLTPTVLVPGAMIGRVGSTGTPVNAIAFSPDGRRVAVAAYTNIYLYAAGKLTQLLSFSTNTIVLSIAFSPDGRTLASGSEDGTLRLWSVATGQTTSYTVARGRVHSLAFAPDGQTLTAGSSNGSLWLWNGVDSRLLPIRTGPDSAVNTMAFAPDGQILAASSDNSTVRLWRVSDGQLLHILQGRTTSVKSIAFASDGQTLAAGFASGMVCLWRVSDGSLLHVLSGHSSVVNSVAFAPAGQMLASGSSDKTVQLWRLTEDIQQWILDADSSVSTVVFSPDGEVLAAGLEDGQVWVWDVPNAERRNEP